jgi:hypothetical protein
MVKPAQGGEIEHEELILNSSGNVQLIETEQRLSLPRPYVLSTYQAIGRYVA